MAGLGLAPLLGLLCLVGTVTAKVSSADFPPPAEENYYDPNYDYTPSMGYEEDDTGDSDSADVNSSSVLNMMDGIFVNATVEVMMGVADTEEVIALLNDTCRRLAQLPKPKDAACNNTRRAFVRDFLIRMITITKEAFINEITSGLPDMKFGRTGNKQGNQSDWGGNGMGEKWDGKKQDANEEGGKKSDKKASSGLGGLSTLLGSGGSSDSFGFGSGGSGGGLFGSSGGRSGGGLFGSSGGGSGGGLFGSNGGGGANKKVMNTMASFSNMGSLMNSIGGLFGSKSR